MKKSKLILMAVCAIMASSFMASCNQELEPVQDEYITVGLECVGEFLEVSHSPLTRAGSQEVYFVEVYSLAEIDMGPGMPPSYNESCYASGMFTSLSGVSVNLMAGTKYAFKVGIVIDYPTAGDPGKSFNYSTSYGGNIYIPNTYEAYYGELSMFSPEESSSVVIDTKRVSYAAKFIAEDLTEGYLDINLSSGASSYSVLLTSDNPVSDKIYSFNSYLSAYWYAVNETTNYSENYTLNITWVKANLDRVPMGSYNVTFERNVRTTIRIKVDDLSSPNGITVNKEFAEFVDGSKEYFIQGGDVVEIPINPM